MTTPSTNKDVEETRRLEKLEKESQAVLAECEDICLLLMAEAARNRPSDMMMILDVLSAKAIVACAEMMNCKVSEVVETHFLHVAKVINVLKKGERK